MKMNRWYWLVLMLTMALCMIALPLLPSHAASLETQLATALAVFATARALNGVISVAQSTELALQPAGVGVSVEIGELLDPVNDLIERFSMVMLIASGAIGVQRIALELSASLVVSLLSLGVLLLWWLSEQLDSTEFRHIMRRLLVLALLLRLAIPVSIWVGQAVDTHLLGPQTQTTVAGLQHVSEALQDVHQEAALAQETGDSFIDRASATLRNLGQQFDWEQRIQRYQDIAEEASRHIVFAVSLFLLQTVLLPLFWVWLFARLVSALLR